MLVEGEGGGGVQEQGWEEGVRFRVRRLAVTCFWRRDGLLVHRPRGVSAHFATQCQYEGVQVRVPTSRGEFTDALCAKEEQMHARVCET